MTAPPAISKAFPRRTDIMQQRYERSSLPSSIWPRAWGGGLLLGLSVSLVSSTAFGEPKHNNVELTPLIGMVQRGAEGPQKVVKYDPGLAVGGRSSFLS